MLAKTIGFSWHLRDLYLTSRQESPVTHRRGRASNSGLGLQCSLEILLAPGGGLIRDAC